MRAQEPPTCTPTRTPAHPHTRTHPSTLAVGCRRMLRWSAWDRIRHPSSVISSSILSSVISSYPSSHRNGCHAQTPSMFESMPAPPFPVNTLWREEPRGQEFEVVIVMAAARISQCVSLETFPTTLETTPTTSPPSRQPGTRSGSSTNPHIRTW